jgi:hypothetical protein
MKIYLFQSNIIEKALPLTHRHQQRPGEEMKDVDFHLHLATKSYPMFPSRSQRMSSKPAGNNDHLSPNLTSFHTLVPGETSW